MEDKRLFRVKRTELEMVKDRGFDTKNAHLYTRNGRELSYDADEILSLKSHDEFLDWLQGDFVKLTDLTTLYTNENNEQLLVFYITSSGKQAGKPDLKLVNEVLQKNAEIPVKNRITNMIIISSNGISPSTLTTMQQQHRMYNMQFFKYSELAFNPMKHVLAPLSTTIRKDVPEWEKYEGINSNKLPVTRDKDALVKWYNASLGDVVECEVMGLTFDTGYSYRVVRRTNKK